MGRDEWGGRWASLTSRPGDHLAGGFEIGGISGELIYVGTPSRAEYFDD